MKAIYPSFFELRDSAPCVYVAIGLDTPCQNHFMQAVLEVLPPNMREIVQRHRPGGLAGLDLEGRCYEPQNNCLYWLNAPGAPDFDKAVLWVIAGLTQAQSDDLLDYIDSPLPRRAVHCVADLLARVDELYDIQLEIRPVELKRSKRT
jgi:hypothetical protein